MQVDPISIAVTHSPSIWTALNIDYPGHSFAQLGIFHEGLNGRLPNQDLLNSFTMISEWGGVPVTLYGTPSTTPVGWLRWVGLDGVEFVREYVRRGRNVLRHVGFQASGRASGAHGVFHQWVFYFYLFTRWHVGEFIDEWWIGIGLMRLLCLLFLMLDRMDFIRWGGNVLSLSSSTCDLIQHRLG